MARIRTIKPEFWQHEDLSLLPEATHILAAALLNHADDEGYFRANPGLVKAACSPLREPSVSIPESLRSLQTIGYIRLGTAPDGKRYGYIEHFQEHQRVSHPTESKIAKLSITWDEFGNPPENIGSTPDTFRPEQGTGNREQEKKEPPNPPSPAKQKRTSAVTFQTWIASVPEGQKAIPADHHVFAYADSVGLPRELLVLAWRWFERRYADEPKRYRDWPAVFRKAVEGNWGKLWFLTADGEYQLTTVGRQFERSQEAA